MSERAVQLMKKVNKYKRKVKSLKKQVGQLSYANINKNVTAYKKRLTNLSKAWRGSKLKNKIKVAGLVQKREIKLYNLAKANKKLSALRSYSEKKLRYIIAITGDKNSRFYSPKANKKYVLELYRRKIIQQKTPESKAARKDALENVKAKYNANKAYAQQDSYRSNGTKHMTQGEYTGYKNSGLEKDEKKEFIERVMENDVKELAQGKEFGYIDEQEGIVISPPEI